MSTNKTQNYQLHSWLPDDEFHLTEINENFTKLDTAVKAEAQALSAMTNTRIRMLTGTYQGEYSFSVETPKRIELGVTPKAVIIMNGMLGMADYDGNTHGSIAFPGFGKGITLDESGFTVFNSMNISSRMNIDGYTYGYLVLY